MLNEFIVMSDQEYHSKNRTELSSSGIKELLKSPAHYWEKYLNPERPEQKETAALKFGKTFHKALLEPEEFKQRLLICPELDKRTKVGKEKFEDFMAQVQTKSIVLSTNEANKLTTMIERLSKHRSLSQILRKGIAERAGFFDFNEKVKCKMKPDFVTESGIIFDVKTTENAHPDFFKKQIQNYRYDIQAAFYMDGFEKITGQKPKMFVWIAIEKEAPYGLSLIKCNNDYYYGGAQDYKRAIDVYQTCLEQNEWPCYPETIVDVVPDSWYFFQHAE